MARVLSQALIPKSGRPLLLLPAFRLLALRGRSSFSDKAQLVEIDLGEAEGDPDLLGSVRLLEEAIDRVVVRRAAPVWLPLLPGSSYWVPPRRKLQSRPGMVELIGRIANPLTEEETMSLRTGRGWPSSSFFLQGFPTQQVEGNLEKDAEKSDSDET